MTVTVSEETIQKLKEYQKVKIGKSSLGEIVDELITDKLQNRKI